MEDASAGVKNLKILPMTFASLEDVLTIERLSYLSPWSRSQFEKELQNPLSNKFIAKILHGRREVVAAFVIYWIVGEDAHILNIAVHPDFRRRGIATNLLCFTLDNLEEKRVKRVFLEVRRSNISAQRLYRCFGFREIGVREGYYGDNNEDAIVMELDMERADFDYGEQ
ncbi:MAG TPA: ribosomal-protein-alanine N-acetyltransferase [Deltaproteobacteria bacterium]|nr:MAG: ribosomal-protein-alanine N-acetyltransferase [Deltaproteobacteria bacterium GWB2_42_7]OGP40027.1 MAG: ribosomal-protein-alanine N-acetyltransferase [Deltaproteobacteria bacterium GWD2_42_10]OGP46190.1 MAG: ribosomal-protein-alanine N-acetyltransferase [Deltaproteobacteria bacterium GWF2_42_12]OGQ24080.1 MAG: ribosomal-protein-alanine N-acetyltransferase [Deltaproteobacteria bacterium RIFCSPHIGHO2_02_FULL_42_44]OGQ35322.1 MAG: ribosomal-protein-alanine N-acetyltransferase [Deltaproteoba